MDAQRDWGHAKDYVEGMWRILQHDKAEDFVLATGEMHTVREFIELAFAEVGIQMTWQGEGVSEKGIDSASGQTLVEVDPRFFRPAEVEELLGNPQKAKNLLGWEHSTPFKQLVKEMVEADMKTVEIEKSYRSHGYE
jgi:GDPmannose 4,6-dehydratase